ncbi:hypothetical protein BTM25_21140 [Actinomadura rubteroloni]|uniref:Uncharacterized protein n=1 Tax=Actinomadura rubteroloni TaxID=1926885 RepID=A0A2P4URM1_9ACTN|nr:hypothetical protein [Actinomadura rubteroloni]POM27695.1 hypothetical protein BTM25_21140 [Actinomadura rubteroloni]
MNETTFHLTHPRFHGPAERTLVEPWLGELSGLALNGYTETAPSARPALVPSPPSVVEALVTPSGYTDHRRRVALAA